MHINTPFNYTGSKFKLLSQIIPTFDDTKSTFVDLFTGSFVVSTNVVEIYDNILSNDLLSDLIKIHEKLISNPYEIIEKVKNYSIGCKQNKEKFLELRNSYNLDKTPEKLWALMLSCTNNMMRFNKDLNFNQTWGNREYNESTENKINIFIEHIKNYKHKIKFSSVCFNDFEKNKDYFYYIDPPYINTEAEYNALWNKTLEYKLYDYILELDEIGASFAISGVLGEHTKNKKSEILYKLIDDGFNYRILNCNYNKVAKIKNKKSEEVLIFNYEKN